MRRFVLAVFVVGLGAVPMVALSRAAAQSGPKPTYIEADGLHNVHKLTDRLFSGSSPEGDTGFASLAKLGIKTIISVDGARPEVERARKHNLRYVHLPIGYDAVPQDMGWRIARAVRDLPGPVYLHCHHGKHRGPAAAAVAMLCLDPTWSIESAVNFMKQAGTDPHYQGLYASPSKLKRPTNADLDRVPSDFPELAKVAALAQLMVKIDEHWERLREVKKAGWKAPSNHPDIDPPHEALQLVELWHESARLAESEKRHPADLLRRLADAEASTRALEQALRAKTPAADNADRQFRRIAAACVQCHGNYRDKSSF